MGIVENMHKAHPFADRWNNNTRWYPRIGEIVSGHQVVLDVGCGDGTLAGHLASLGHQVIGVDRDSAILPPDAPNTHFMLGDAVSLPFENDSFDAVTAVMMLHHTHQELALVEMRRVLKPGGVMVICGTAKDRAPSEMLRSLADVPENLISRVGTTAWEPGTVKLDATQSWRQTRATIFEMLPGARWERIPGWRYLAVWQRPDTDQRC